MRLKRLRETVLVVHALLASAKGYSLAVTANLYSFAFLRHPEWCTSTACPIAPVALPAYYQRALQFQILWLCLHVVAYLGTIHQHFPTVLFTTVGSVPLLLWEWWGWYWQILLIMQVLVLVSVRLPDLFFLTLLYKTKQQEQQERKEEDDYEEESSTRRCCSTGSSH